MATAEGFDHTDARGKEGITSDDLRLSFLAIAQKTSRALDPTDGTYIDGLKFLDLYDTETRVIHGPGPLHFVPLIHRKRAHLRGENGRLEREALAWNDPRVTWEGAKAAGHDKPEGVRIYDWVVLLLPACQLVVLSFMSKSFSTGQSLITFVKMRSGPAFAGRYTVKSVRDENDSGVFGKFMVAPAGKPETHEVTFAADVYETIKGKTLVVEPEGLDPDETDEGATAPAEM